MAQKSVDDGRGARSAGAVEGGPLFSILVPRGGQPEDTPTVDNVNDESGYYDVYALAAERSDAIVRRFQSRWLTGLTQAAADYPVPMFHDRPVAVYASAAELIDHLLLEPDQEYAIYWSRNPGPGEDLLSAHLFFTRDGGLIAGLTIGADRFAETAATLHELAGSVGAQYGYATGEEPPPYETTAEFIARVRLETDEIKLVPD